MLSQKVGTKEADITLFDLANYSLVTKQNWAACW